MGIKLIKKYSLILMMTLQISACAAYNTEFKCKPSEGVGCKPLSEVHEMIQDGTLGTQKNVPVKQNEHTKVSVIENHNVTDHISGVARSKEKFLKIWFDHFIDEEGNFFGEQSGWIVIEPGKWVTKTVGRDKK